VVGEIAAEAAHELRNALAVIAASAELLRSADGPQREALLGKIQRNARLAQAVLDAMMALARGDELHGDAVSLAHAMSEARRDVPAARGALGYVDEVPGAISVRGSEILLSRMFRVLYENAIQAGATRIETTARIEGAAVIIDVRDDGPGVPAECRETLFDPLVTTKKEGTGLGLALARRVAHAHGGDVALVTSDSGACFRITLNLG
jgi:signal transduction histidine kinase